MINAVQVLEPHVHLVEPASPGACDGVVIDAAAARAESGAGSLAELLGP